jgi:hypothetical protein
VIRCSCRALAVVLVFAAMLAAAPSAWAAKAISTTDYAGSVCQVEGPFFTAMAAATNALQVNGSSADPTTVRNALSAFADDARAATAKFRTGLTRVGTAKSSAVQASTVEVLAKLRTIDKSLAATKRDVGELVVGDVNAFGTGLVIVQKDLVKVSKAYSDIGTVKNPKALDAAIAKDPVCQKVVADAAARASG